MSISRRVFNEERLQSVLKKTSVLANLLQSRLALPLTYPLNTAAYRAPEEDRKNPISVSKFSQRDIVDSLGCITPVIQGVTQLSHLIKATHALSNYQGGRYRGIAVRKEAAEGADTPKPKDKIHMLFKHINRKHRARTTVGLGAGWDRYSSGRPVDTVQDRWQN